MDTWEVLNDVGISNAASLFLVWPMLRTSLQLAFKLMREILICKEFNDDDKQAVDLPIALCPMYVL